MAAPSCPKRLERQFLRRTGRSGSDERRPLLWPAGETRPTSSHPEAPSPVTISCPNRGVDRPFKEKYNPRSGENSDARDRHKSLDSL